MADAVGEAQPVFTHREVAQQLLLHDLPTAVEVRQQAALLTALRLFVCLRVRGAVRRHGAGW
jgi:hypothetical protein